MTKPRWMQDIEDELAQGPVETRVRAELKALGWDEDSLGTKLSTAGMIAISLAETLDRTSAARDKATLTRELSARLLEARGAGEKPTLSLVQQAKQRGGRKRSGPGPVGEAGSA